jgi:H+/Cl- antiporter ClcA
VVTPQFVIGAVAGNVLAHYLGINPALGAAIGLVAVLASASNTPIAAILMGVELFGGTGLLYVAGASISAYLLIGHRSIYPDQRLAYAKSSWVHLQSELPIGQEKVHLSYGLLKWWSQRKNRP